VGAGLAVPSAGSGGLEDGAASSGAWGSSGGRSSVSVASWCVACARGLGSSLVLGAGPASEFSVQARDPESQVQARRPDSGGLGRAKPW